jgi:hypothetical protein
MLSAEGPGGALSDGGPLVRIRLEVVDADENPLSSVRVGEEFTLRAWVDDLREGEAAEGVAAAYLDVWFRKELVAAAGDGQVTFAKDFPHAHSFASEAGHLDEVGAFAGYRSADGTEEVLWSVRLRAIDEGLAQFVADAADDLPGRYVLLYGIDDGIAASEIAYDGAQVQITAADGSLPVANDFPVDVLDKRPSWAPRPIVQPPVVELPIVEPSIVEPQIIESPVIERPLVRYRLETVDDELELPVLRLPAEIESLPAFAWPKLIEDFRNWIVTGDDLIFEPLWTLDYFASSIELANAPDADFTQLADAGEAAAAGLPSVDRALVSIQPARAGSVVGDLAAANSVLDAAPPNALLLTGDAARLVATQRRPPAESLGTAALEAALSGGLSDD